MILLQCTDIVIKGTGFHIFYLQLFAASLNGFREHADFARLSASYQNKDTGESSLTPVSRCWHRWVVVDTGVSLLTPVRCCWHRWVVVDTGELLLTPVSRCWHRWVVVDTGESLLTPVSRCWHRWIVVDTGDILLIQWWSCDSVEIRGRKIND